MGKGGKERGLDDELLVSAYVVIYVYYTSDKLLYYCAVECQHTHK